MSQDNQNNDNLVGGDPNKPVIGPATQALANKVASQFMAHAEGQTITLNYANPEDPSAPRIVIKSGNPQSGGQPR